MKHLKIIEDGYCCDDDFDGRLIKYIQIYRTTLDDIKLKSYSEESILRQILVEIGVAKEEDELFENEISALKTLLERNGYSYEVYYVND